MEVIATYRHFDQSFCDKLEYALTKAFGKINDPDLKGFWCDGVLPDQISIQKLLIEKVIETTAWIGQDGQTKFDMTIFLGVLALERITRNEGLEDCIPLNLEDVLNISADEKWVEMHLD